MSWEQKPDKPEEPLWYYLQTKTLEFYKYTDTQTLEFVFVK